MSGYGTEDGGVQRHRRGAAALMAATLAAGAVLWALVRLGLGRMAGASASRRRLRALRNAIVSNTRQNVASVFGLPRAAGTGESVALAPDPQTVWLAETWYYPLHPRQRSAIAIRFDNDRVREVDVIRPPLF